MKDTYIISGVDTNTLESVYLLERGYIFTPKLTEDCYFTSPIIASDVMSLAIVLHDNVIDVKVEKLVDNPDNN